MHTNLNLAILRGTATGAAVQRELAEGHVAQFDLTTQVEIGDRPSSVSVPIAWYDPTEASIATVDAGAQLLVIGTVRRRFFQAGGIVQSRTEVVADCVIPVRRSKTARQALNDAITRAVE